jgi:hypothetical protein
MHIWKLLVSLDIDNNHQIFGLTLLSSPTPLHPPAKKNSKGIVKPSTPEAQHFPYRR